MDNNFNNNGGSDDDRTVLIQQDQYGNPQFNQPMQPVQPQFNQQMQSQYSQPQGQSMQPQYGQSQGQSMQPQYGQPQGQSMQSQYGQPQGQSMQSQYGQPQYGQQMQYGQNSQYGASPYPQQMSLNPNNNTPKPPKKGKGGMIAIISVCALLVIGLIVGLVLFFSGDDEDDDKKTTEATTEITTEDTIEETTEATTEEKTEETTEATTEEKTEETTEATTEATTEETTEAPATTVDTSNIAFTTNDWKSLEFAIDGVVYTWPISYSQLKERGYSVDSDIEAETLEANYYSFSEWADKDGEHVFFVQFKNFTDEDKTVADCDILAFKFESTYLEDSGVSIVLCNGVTFGMSYDEVIAIMGTPTDEYVSEDSESGYRTATYEVTDDVYANSIEFTFMDGKIYDIEITNYD